MAPSQSVLRAVLDVCQHMKHHYGDTPAGGVESDTVKSVDSTSSEVEVPPSLIKYPAGESRLRQFFHMLLFPILLLMQITVPDPRITSNEKGPRLSIAMLSISLCIVWLIVGSYAMVASLEMLGDLMRLPNSVIGQTISAAGTSLPNYVASQVAARQGLGVRLCKFVACFLFESSLTRVLSSFETISQNMAVSNAFGSNTFNIFIGLGIPWLMYTLFVGEYNGLQDDGITESVLILVAVLVAFVVLIFWTNFTLCRWHAIAFFMTYAIYVICVVVQGYI
jgi:Ca2+/Na+ antiporter